MNKYPVVAAIPNFNMASELDTLLPLLQKHKYHQIFVLDDASTDNSRAIAEKYTDSVTFVPSKVNQGAGATRNRIIDALDYPAMIHFLDADTIPATDDMPTAILKCLPSEEFAFIGGLTFDLKQRQNIWNYGPRPSLRNEYGAVLQARYGSLLKVDSDKAKQYREKHGRFLSEWPDSLSSPEPTEVFWAIEQNLVFRSDIFKRYGGFDETNCETEIVELALRMKKDGLKAYFDPGFAITHTEAQVRNYNRSVRKRKESIRLIVKYGIKEWLTS